MKKINEFVGVYAPFSNFYVCDGIFAYDGDGFETLYSNNAEALFQAAKSLNPEDRLRIAELPPNLAKRYGRAVALRGDWEQVKVEVMRKVVVAKFEAFPRLMDLLKSTGDAYIEEGNVWHDRIWGRCYCGGNQKKTVLVTEPARIISGGY